MTITCLMRTNASVHQADRATNRGNCRSVIDVCISHDGGDSPRKGGYVADYFLEFSQVLPHLNNDEFDWLAQQLEIVCVFGQREFSPAALPAGLEESQADWTGHRFCRDYEEDLPDPENLGVCFVLHDKPDDDFGRHLWVYAEEYGDLGVLAHLVQKFLRRFRPSECWSLAYASTCSKLRLDGFGGGAVFVTTDEIKFDSAWDFIERQMAAFSGRSSAVAPAESA
jgi:hypothetical protein